ncbi:YqaE/Pmp3 family membrane protein [Marivirga sp. S37H4]|uniref:YqaE/Pmp3 family membrane protein n=1 Tax=Marivirga aurantiaca TaxID=2802615 RepID=A0A935CA41_9BACT|nr:YqaE/Pmp3 family membrane protein [Marivirga aurantiaca]MBK6265977.1 YqaE/Pmp3 family membrane protein [Marivirga aurantiaca]
MSLIQIILAVFIPPLAVALSKGLTGAFWLNLLLTILGIIPGIIHAFYVLTR